MGNVNLKEIQQKLIDKLDNSGWNSVLKTYLLSSDFLSVLERLKLESDQGQNFTPIIKNLFRAFEECPYNDLKVVVVGQDPYPKANVADGIAFSCSQSSVQASLRYIFTGLDAEGIEHSHNPDLTRWANQGVLMLNTALTTQVGNIGTHIELWKPFMTYLFDMLKHKNTGIVYIFLGKKAEEYMSYVDSDLNYCLLSSHPASAAYTKLKQWDSKNVFTETNKILNNLYGSTITW